MTAELLAQVEPAEVRAVVGEPTRIAAERPDRWARGTPLDGIRSSFRGQASTPVPDALEPGSVVVRRGGTVLRSGSDYTVDERWGMLGGGDGAAAVADYRYALLRVDSIVDDGAPRIVRGRGHLTTPLPPPLPDRARHIANVFVPYRGDPIVLPITESPAPQANPPPELTVAKLHAGQSVRVVCWGDSVTAGGDSSSQETAYPAVLERGLRRHYPSASVEVQGIAVGGSTSAQWLRRDGACDFDRVAAARPDLVTLEFVNDCTLPVAELPRWYDEIAARLAELGAELLLTTPHFTMAEMMGNTERDERPYVEFLRTYAVRKGIALADVSARWEHLAAEGLPYLTLLRNGINHPDDRGHALYTEELLRSLTAR